MARQQRPLVIAFDPGVTTGVAIVNVRNEVIYTAAVNERVITVIAKRLQRKYEGALVAIEAGPLWRNDSPVTRTVEQELRNIFPSAVLVTPNRWKRHPAAQCSEKLLTTHERDAVRLARWFKAKGVIHAEGQNEEENTT